MTRFDRAALAAALALAPISTAASAEAMREHVSASVSVHDIDFSTSAGRSAFQARVRRAARHTCGTSYDLRGRSDMLRCRGEMMKDGEVRLAALTRARGTELAAR
ncbi:UrcA family protein [Sphingomonas endophytica]|uniref:UrcA family protein n=1 Tax=Sphingomonas endophytica TaxID=869719 RepID=A0A147IA30_9SPHN|nr:UrcA family protein [Sphingomonas endophytica]KTT76728.1 hypothetical protein NS334_00490 [Sphingomonas endophytica]